MGDGSTHILPAGMRSDRIVVHVVAERTGVARVSDRYVWIVMADGDGRAERELTQVKSDLVAVLTIALNLSQSLLVSQYRATPPRQSPQRALLDGFGCEKPPASIRSCSLVVADPSFPHC